MEEENKAAVDDSEDCEALVADLKEKLSAAERALKQKQKQGQK